MKTIYIASGNAHKIEEITTMLKELSFDVKGLSDVKGYVAPEETGLTFMENSLIKARALKDHLAGLGEESAYVLADDSGLVCDDLKGAPGVHSARFAGPEATDAENNAKLIQLFRDDMQDLTRSARYVCAMVVIAPNGSIKEIEDSCEGRIIMAPSGENGFGYDPYFYLEDLDKTMAEINPLEKNQISHRGKALRKLVKQINEI